MAIIVGAMSIAALAQRAPPPPGGGPPGGPGGPDGRPPPDGRGPPMRPPARDRETPPARVAPTTRTSLPTQVDRAIERGGRYLLSRQEADGRFLFDNSERDVGSTALVALALINCGESHQSPAIKNALAFCKATKTNQTYCVGLRAAFYSALPEALRREELKADVKALVDGTSKDRATKGMYHYALGDNSGDYSNSQYGVLGAWYASQVGVEVATPYWRLIDEAWKRGQENVGGGWGYNPGDRSYASMTAAGAATLFVTYDAVASVAEQNLDRRPPNIAIERAMAWIAKNFDPMNNTGSGTNWLHYMLYGYERVGEASGLTRFGDRKWFDEGATYLINTQNYDGSWNASDSMTSEINTAYALLFLSRGRAPVAIQKLQFPGRWNNRSRDVATITRWLGNQLERHSNWQIVNVKAPMNELRAAPVLYLASDRAVAFTSEEQEKLRRFVLQGGLLLCVNEGFDKAFADSIENLGPRLFPGTEFRNLPDDHVINNAGFPVKGLRTDARILGNGVREFIVLMPKGDMSWRWQLGAGSRDAKNSPYFGFAGNVVLYVTDRANPRYKGSDWWVDMNPAITTNKVVQVTRLRPAGNTDPEPAGWDRLWAIFHNEHATALDVKEATPTEPAIEGKSVLAHLTSVGAFELSTPERAAIKTYLDGGGLLLFDAAGGSVEAAASFEKAMAAIYPAAKFEPLPGDHPIFAGAVDWKAIDAVTYRRFARSRVGGATTPRLQGMTINGKLVAIESREDLSFGLVGSECDGVVGYSPESATAVVRNILLWRAAVGRAPTTIPAH